LGKLGEAALGVANQLARSVFWEVSRWGRDQGPV